MWNLNKGFLVVVLGCFGASCATLPSIKHKEYAFPREAYPGIPDRPYEVIGSVRSKENFPTLDPEIDQAFLCRNYFNKAVLKLVRDSKRVGADAVIDIKSVIFLMDGRSEAHSSAECYDDGAEGQVLARGLAVKWLKSPEKDRNATN